jgi:hypothetical protein
VSWSLRFAEPIVLPNGSKLATLRQAIAHLVNTIPPTERSLPVVLTAAEMLANAAGQHGPVEFARIATLQALNRHAVRTFNPDRETLIWGGGAETGHGMMRREPPRITGIDGDRVA